METLIEYFRCPLWISMMNVLESEHLHEISNTAFLSCSVPPRCSVGMNVTSTILRSSSITLRNAISTSLFSSLQKILLNMKSLSNSANTCLVVILLSMSITFSHGKVPETYPCNEKVFAYLQKMASEHPPRPILHCKFV